MILNYYQFIHAVLPPWVSTCIFVLWSSFLKFIFSLHSCFLISWEHLFIVANSILTANWIWSYFQFLFLIFVFFLSEDNNFHFSVCFLIKITTNLFIFSWYLTQGNWQRPNYEKEKMGSGTGLCHLENFRLYQKISQIRTKRETGKFLKIILKTSFLFHNKNKKNFTIKKFLIPVFVHKSNILPASGPDRQKFVRLLWNGRKTRHTLLQNPGLGLIFQLQKSNLFKLF